MNHQLWSEHLATRVHQLERDNQRLRARLSRHKKRAELWRARALRPRKRR